MDLDFDTDQSELRRSVRSFLDKECPVSLVREMVESDGSWKHLWSQMSQLSWPALTVADEHGGLGLGLVDLAIVLEELGRSIAPGPFLPTTTEFLPAVREAADTDQAATWMRAVATGECTGSLALFDDGAGWSAGSFQTTARRRDGDWLLEGVKRHVIEAGTVDELVVAAQPEGPGGGDRVGLFVVPSAEVAVTPTRALDATRQIAKVTLESVRVPRERVLGTPGEQNGALRRALDEATLGIAIETVGTCQAIFDMALEHSRNRHQFGVPIGSFQAMKHKFADMLVSLERARAITYLATAAAAENDENSSLLVSAAKSATADAERHIAQEGIQSLGGIGYTWEHDIHLFVKRAKSSGALFGGSRQHLEVVASRIGLGDHR